MKFKTELTKNIFSSKYFLEGETHQDQAVQRVGDIIDSYYPERRAIIQARIDAKELCPAGGMWRAAGNPDKNVSSINCTTLPKPTDDLESIADSWYWWAKYAAFGQGEGIDYSNLRPRGSLVHNTSRSSTGAVSFMAINDAILNVIAQKGRRGATLISLHISHPDIPEFIFVKDKDGVLTNSNISIQTTDEFMRLVTDPKAVWSFTFKNKYETIKKDVGASDLFQMICDHAWKSGDPGLQFLDTVKEESNSDALGYPVISTNACSEQWLDPDNVCLLSSINLANFNNIFTDPSSLTRIADVTYDGIYMLDSFRRYEYDSDRSPNPVQKKLLVDLPRIGLGVTGLADYFINNGIVYGSEESISHVQEIFKTIARHSYCASYDIARKDGHSFPLYDKKKYMKSAYIKRLLDEGVIDEYILDMQAHVCKTTIAPTGTLAEIAEVGGSGIEPLFARYYVRRERVTTGDWKEWFTFNHAVRNYLEKNEIEVTKENADKLTDPIWVTAHHLDNLTKIKLVAEVQKWVDSSISVTYNLPEEATPEHIKEIYYEAWKNKLKGVTVFREGCKPGVLITEDNYDDMIKKRNSANRFSTSRPMSTECDIYERMVNRIRHIVLVGKVEGRPYEIFVTDDPENKIDLQKYKTGYITKIAKGRYDLQVVNGEEKTIIEDISKVFDKEYGTLSRLISMSLRHEVPIPFIMDQLSKSSEFDSFEKAVVRTLKTYVEEGAKVVTSDACPYCGSELVFQGGCKTCVNPECMWSKCE